MSIRHGLYTVSASLQMALLAPLPAVVFFWSPGIGRLIFFSMPPFSIGPSPLGFRHSVFFGKTRSDCEDYKHARVGVQAEGVVALFLVRSFIYRLGIGHATDMCTDMCTGIAWTCMQGGLGAGSS